MSSFSWRNRLLAAALVGLAVSASALAEATIREETQDGQKVIVLENEFLRLVVTPERGGNCTDFVYKPTDTRLVERRVGAFLGVRVWNYANADLYTQWQKLSWEFQVSRRAGEVELTLRRAGEVDFTRSTTWEKRITLRDGESMARVAYSFEVGQELMESKTVGLWFFNQLGAPGRRTSYRFPLDDGLVTLASGGAGDAWFYNPARGWAALWTEDGTGLCFNMEFRRLMCFYLYSAKQSTCEWAFRTMDIQNGNRFTTEGSLIAYSGLGPVNGSGNGAVAALDAPDKATLAEALAGLAVKVRLTSGVAQSGSLVVVLRDLPSGAEIPLHRGDVTLKPGVIEEAAFQARAPKEGTYLLVGRLLRNGNEVMDFVKPLQVGEAASPVRIAAKEERLGRVTERFEDRRPLAGGDTRDLTYSTEIETPHVAWARPYAGGRLKVLVLTSCLIGREAAELAQRLDMDIVWVTAGSDYELGSLSYLYGSGNRNQGTYTVQNMNEKIKNALLQPCDVIVVGGLAGNLFSDEVVDLFARKVDEGVGLVYVAPTRGSDKLYSLLPVGKETVLRGRGGTWTSAGDHYITAGIPFDVLPETDYTVYPAAGEVLAKVGRYPLIVSGQGPGKGRTVVLSYNTSWQGSGSYSAGITPFVEEANVEFPYWEYYFSLLAKSIVWSAGKEAPVQLASMTAEAANAAAATLLMRNPGPAIPVMAEVKVSDAYGRVEHEMRSPWTVPEGAGRLHLPLPDHLTAGLHLVDVILKTDDGKTLTWGSASLRTTGPAQLNSIDFDKRVYHPDEIATATVGLASSDGRSRDAVVRAVFTDALGRDLLRATQNVRLAGPATVRFRIPVGKPLVTTARLGVSVEIGGRAVAYAEREAITLPEEFAGREWQDWEHGLWGNTGGSYGREYLFPIRARRLKDFGISTVLASANWLNEREFEESVRQGFKLMPMNCSFGYINIGHRPRAGKMTFKEQRTEYQKTHDKKYLVRPVSLNDPEDLEPLAVKLREVGRYAGWMSPLFYNLGDEMSVTHYVTPMDYDFAPAALAEFRVWLKGEYASLEALNAGWGTAFKSWDAVVPMTAEEVKARGNYSPWADHRAFMDLTFRRFFDWVRACLREEDPQATVGLSGSQAAEAFGGYDWSRLPGHLDAAQTYTLQNTEIMHRSFGPDLHRAPWHGYGGFNPRLRWTLWWRLFNGNYGGSYFAVQSIFKPDLTYGRTAEQMAPLVWEFKNGTAKLLKSCKRMADIGVHYSHASIRGAAITGAAARFRENRMGWIKTFEDEGYQCEFLASHELEKGELLERGYKAFVLPYSVALSEKEAQALSAYVAAGGLLLADAKIGLMDERCRTLERARLEDLFGVQRRKVDPLAPSREGDARFTADQGDCRLSGLQIDFSVAEPELKAGAGTPLGAHGSTPIAVVRKTGRGTAVFLNFYMETLPRMRELRIDAPVRGLVANLLKLGGVAPPAAVTMEGAPQERAYVVRYASDNAAYLGVLLEALDKPDDWSADVRIEMPATGYVYDVRNGKDLGRVGEVKTSLLAGDAALFAIMPYRVTGLAVTPPAEGVAAGQTVRYEVALRTDGPQPGTHVVRVEILGPDGKTREHYAAKILTANGKGGGEFRTALNDPVGTWTLRATDLVSGTQQSARFDIKQQPAR